MACGTFRVAAAINIEVPRVVLGLSNSAIRVGESRANRISLVGDLNVADWVTLSGTHVTVSLARTSGLSFSAGDGTSDAIMTFQGSLADVNAALDGLTLSGAAGYVGPATLAVSVSGSQSVAKNVGVVVSEPLDLPAAQNQILSGVTTLPSAFGTNAERVIPYCLAAGGLFNLLRSPADPSPLL